MPDTEPNGVTRTAKATVLDTMEQEIAPPLANATGFTNAPSAALQSTMHRRSMLEDPFPIVMPFQHWVWKSMLEDAGILNEYTDIPAGIEHGFLTGLENFNLTQTFAPKNHCSEPEHLSFLHEKYSEEIQLGRLSRGYEPEELQALIGKTEEPIQNLS